MIAEGATYRRRETFTITGAQEYDYVVVDDRGREYLVDKAIFSRDYEIIPDQDVHQEVWEKLNKLNNQLYQARKTNKKLKGQLRKERQAKDDLLGIKRKKEKAFYKNGKRGTFKNG